jgi:DNA-binding XRE family transcriptional regulator
MRTLYLPYQREFDQETSTWTVTGRDSEGQDYGVAAGESIELAEERLKDWVLDSLLASAGDGEDRLGDLVADDPGGAIAFTAVDLVPIRVRLLRTRHGLSQAQMAERLGVSQQAFAKLERPGANLQLRTIQQVESAVEEDLLELA